MQVTQTLAEGLKKEFKVVLPASDLAAKLESQLNEMRAKAQIKGFRPERRQSRTSRSSMAKTS